MIAILRLIAAFIANLFKPRRRLEAEILFLRHQLNIAFQGLVANEIGCARISMMAREQNTPSPIPNRRGVLHLASERAPCPEIWCSAGISRDRGPVPPRDGRGERGT